MNKEKEWFNKGKFYRFTNGDGTTYNGFENNMEIGGKNEAKDWNPDITIECGQGIHVVEGHPLLVFRSISRNNPVFFEVETHPNPPIPSLSGEKYRCKYVINKRIIDDASPEFNPEFLAQIATTNEDCDVRQAAIERFDSEEHAELLAQIAKTAEDSNVRQIAVEKLDPEKHAKLLAQIAKTDEKWRVRKVAVGKLDPKKHAKLLAQIARENKTWGISQAAKEKLNS